MLAGATAVALVVASNGGAVTALIIGKGVDPAALKTGPGTGAAASAQSGTSGGDATLPAAAASAQVQEVMSMQLPADVFSPPVLVASHAPRVRVGTEALGAGLLEVWLGCRDDHVIKLEVPV